jgi:hypothetical protein
VEVKGDKLWEEKYKGRYTLVLVRTHECCVETRGVCGIKTKSEAKKMALNKYPDWAYRIRPTTKYDFYMCQTNELLA